MSLGSNLRERRKVKGLTMKKLGEMVGISEQGIGNYERDEREPSIRNLFRIAIILGITFDELKEWVEVD